VGEHNVQVLGEAGFTTAEIAGLADAGVDLLRKSGEFPVSNEELDDTATTVYEGI
jgi:hypothetical protein